MSMNATTLGAAVKAAMDAEGPYNSEAETFDQYRLRLEVARAQAIITHITGNAIVNTVVSTPDTINGTGTGTIS